MLKKTFTIISFLTLVTAAFAQSKPVSDIQYITTSPVDTIFVSATRVRTRIFNLPISTSLILHTDIQNKSDRDIASALSGTAGLDIRNYSLVNSASSISLFGSTSQQVLVLLDGLPVNSASTGMPDLGLIPITNLDRIEIVKGPFSSLYGANALGGVVNLITQTPFDILISPSYQISYKYGSYNTSQFSFTDRIKNLNTIVNYLHTKSDGMRTNDDILFESINLTSGYQFDSLNKMRVNMTINSKQLGLPGPLPDTSQYPRYGDATSFSRYDRQKDILFLIKPSVDLAINPNWNLILNSHYLVNNSDFKWVDQWTQDTSLYQDQYQSRTFIINLINHYQYARFGRIALGADFENNRFSAFAQYPSDTSWHPVINKFGVFAEGSHEYKNKLNTFVSIRFDHNSGFGNFISPAIGFNTAITPNLKLRTHLGKAFRAPTLNDLYWPVSGNPAIKPEIGTAYQIGLDYLPHPQFSLSLTGFTRKTKNLISWLPDTANIWRPTNIDSSEIFGLEFQTKIQLTQNLPISISGTWQNAAQTRKELVYDDWQTQTTRYEYTKRQQAFLPDLLLSLNIGYKISPNTDIIFLANYTGTRLNYYTDYSTLPDISMLTKKLPAHLICSSAITQQIHKQIKLVLKTENIFNTRYAEQFGNSITDKDYPRPLRTIFIGVEIQN
ncbi:MAG: TonB-dependent receptor [Candidatus Latescibacteria bacterium]|nr:TonB-dependent receptor [Candidatus Latescibacterota bacterium]